VRDLAHATDLTIVRDIVEQRLDNLLEFAATIRLRL